MIENNLVGQIALVTGGTRGIGRSVVENLLKAGASVIMTGTSPNYNVSGFKLTGDQYLSYKQLDFSSQESIEKFLMGLDDIDKIHILVNNAGINRVDQNIDTSTTDFDAILDVNLKGPYILTREVSRKMITQNYGRIVNISSLWSVVSRKGRSIYSTSKWGLVGLTKVLSIELAQYNILVNAISPGFTLTELTQNTNTAEELIDLAAAIPLQRLAEPWEIANWVSLLAGPVNTYISGQNIVIDGGYSNV